MRVFAVANQKGGVGKTTCCINLAAALGTLGVETLVLDMDPQGNCTSGLGIERKNLSKSIYHVLVEGASMEEVLVPTAWKGVHLVPATLDLAGAEVELAGAMSRENRLRRQLHCSHAYDLVLIDCPPSLGLLTVNALVAAEKILVPIQCEYFALEGVGQLTRTVRLIQGYLNEALALGGVVLTMFDGRTRLAKEVAEEVRRQFGSDVFETIIPRNVRLSEAPSFGQPISYYDPASAGADAYDALAKEVQARWFAEKR